MYHNTDELLARQTMDHVKQSSRTIGTLTTDQTKRLIVTKITDTLKSAGSLNPRQYAVAFVKRNPL